MKINGCKILIYLTFICAFILPTYFLQSQLGYDLVEYIFLAGSLFVYIADVAYERKITGFEIVTLLIILFLCVAKSSITPLYLTELLAAYRLANFFSENEIKINRGILFICALFTVIYSLIYFGHVGRYIYTGLREVNQSGYAIFMLFIIIRKYNKKLGNLLLLIGLFTFSRNYLLCLVIYFILEKIKNKQFFIKISKHFNFRNLAILSFVSLIFLSILFNYAYKNNKISEYQQGWNRYLTLFDNSNYARFTVNTKLLEIYAKNPSYLLTGLEDELFYDLSLRVSVEKGIPYRQIKPHNYFFSYLRIYGIFSLFIFVIVGEIMKRLINKNNISILIILFIYANFLGIGFANYWLFLSMIALAVYRKE